jgi:hypothetical protein
MFDVILWCLKFPPISSTQSIFLPQRVIWSFRVCGSSLTRTPPRPDQHPGPSDDGHASRETRGDALWRRLLRRGFERRQSLTRQCSVANTALISRSLLLPLAPSKGVAPVACRATASGRQHLPASSELEPGRQGRPTQSSCLKHPSPSDPVPLAVGSSSHTFLLISPVLFRVSSIMNKNLADVVFLESFTSY